MTNIIFAQHTVKRFFSFNTVLTATKNVSKTWFVLVNGVEHKLTFNIEVDALTARKASDLSGLINGVCLLPAEYEEYRKPKAVIDPGFLLAAIRPQPRQRDVLFLVNDYDKAAKLLPRATSIFKK